MKQLCSASAEEQEFLPTVPDLRLSLVEALCTHLGMHPHIVDVGSLGTDKMK